MKINRSEFGLLLLITLLILLSNRLFWGITPVVILSIIYTYGFRQPWLYLVVMALTVELFSVWPAGLATVIVFLPGIIHRIMQRVEVDLSFKYLGLIMLTVSLQLGTIILPNIIILKNVAIIPWQWLAPIFLIAAAASYILTIFIKFNSNTL